jgi:two-component system sensor histidine kinase/response regulator
MTQATIRVLEDDEGLLMGVRDILEIQGYAVLTATNGYEGLALMREAENPPDLIVSDIMMPGMDGYQFLETVRQNEEWTSIPFIFLTARGEKTDVRAGKMLGADDYVTKPFEAEDLVVCVASKLRRSREIGMIQSAQVAEIKQRILTILHHEFRTPLTYVVAYSDLLNREFDTLSMAEMREFLNGINSGAERLRRLIENFILLVELETGTAAETFLWRRQSITDMHTILAQAIAQARPFADERGVELDLLPVPPLPPVTGDAEYLKAAVTRLIDNGIKFNNKPDGRVEVSAQVSGREVWLQVADNGRGIPERELQTIFQIFYQIKRQLYEDQGAGAGLPIVRRIVQLHGGHVEVSSAFGQGSAFTICLPVVAQ